MKNLIKKAKGFTLIELMVVIVIVGILAAVAIPKFLDASHKAKASEFPTQLTAIYTGEMAFQAENGSYAGTFTDMRDIAGVDISSTSKWFTYSLTGAAQTFKGTAKVASDFGVAAINDWATIDQDNVKSAHDHLLKYCPSWKNN
jgi:prepilin-type N-terminal cleavage/methylation domain-containing protein